MNDRGRRRRAGAVWLLLAVLGGAALAGEPAEPPADRPASIAEAVAAEAASRTWRRVTAGRLRFGHPQRVSGALGLIFAKLPESWDCTTVCDYRGVLVQIEPGVTGGQLAAGYAVVIADQGRSRTHLRHVYLGYAFKGALLRTWGDSSLDPQVQTLAGFETEFTIVRVNTTLGVFRNVSGGGPGADDWVVTGGLGWGF